MPPFDMEYAENCNVTFIFEKTTGNQQKTILFTTASEKSPQTDFFM